LRDGNKEAQIFFNTGSNDNYHLSQDGFKGLPDDLIFMEVDMQHKVGRAISDEEFSCVKGKFRPYVEDADDIIDNGLQLVSLLIKSTIVVPHIIETGIDSHLSHLALQSNVKQNSFKRQVEMVLDLFGELGKV
jgi:hypothetical protein